MSSPITLLDKATAYLGFSDKYATSAWIVFSSITCLVALVRSPLLTEAGLAAFSPPGEVFIMRHMKPNFAAHLAMVIAWCFLGVLQFVPAVRQSMSHNYHRVAGRAFLLLSAGVAASGLSMASTAFGGHFVAQVGLFVLSLSFVLAGFMGYRSIRNGDVPAHRDWMLRLFAYGTSVITLRVFMFVGLRLTSALGVYTTARCDVVLHVLKNDAQAVSDQFPTCLDAPPDRITSIQAVRRSAAGAMAAFQISYDCGILLALLIHAMLAEAWILWRFHQRRENSFEGVARGDGEKVVQVSGQLEGHVKGQTDGRLDGHVEYQMASAAGANIAPRIAVTGPEGVEGAGTGP